MSEQDAWALAVETAEQPAAPTAQESETAAQTEAAEQPTEEGQEAPSSASEAAEASETTAGESATTEAAPVEPKEEQAEDPKVKREARRVYFDIQRRGGEEAYRQAMGAFEDFRAEGEDSFPLLQRLYNADPIAYDRMVRTVARVHRDDLAALISEGKAAPQTDNGQPTTEPEAKADPVQWAKSILEGKAEWATEEDKAAAQFILDAHEKAKGADEVPQLKKQLNEIQQRDFDRQFSQLETKFYGDLEGFGTERLDELGLKAAEGDPEYEDVQAFREDLLDQEKLVRAFQSDPANRKLADVIVHFSGQLDEAGLMNQLPGVKLWLEGYLQEKVKPYVRALERGRERRRLEASERDERIEIDGSGSPADLSGAPPPDGDMWGYAIQRAEQEERANVRGR